MPRKTSFPSSEIRDGFVPKDDYLSADFAALEDEYLWPKVWQVACRIEEIPNKGDYVTYEIVDESIIVVRTGESEGEIKAFYNVCPHRGNLLTAGCGNAKQFFCSYHGWSFSLDGQNNSVVDREDWGDSLNDENTRLGEIQIGAWGGFVWINMDPDCQPLEEFLKPMTTLCERHEFEKLRFAWYKTTIVPANWKTVIEAFTEFYHVQTTHSQMLVYTQDYSISRGMGRHGWISYEAGTGLPVGRSPRLPPKEELDFRNYVFEYAEQFKNDLQAMQTERAYQAAQRLHEEVSADAEPAEVSTKWFEFILDAAQEAGTGWPEGLTPEYMAESGFDWHVFPNTVFLHPAVEAVLWYRMRPNGRDHESCIFDIWSLERFPPGEEPPLKREFYPAPNAVDWPLIYAQDLANIPKVQKGMRSRGFKGALTNPIQERAISNFHRVLRRFMEDSHADDDLDAEPRPEVPGD
jgi:phenylpropionate dioxygenase-like ring-hydroxylating dioxygenase large terminal subunit